jgi:multidrug efflux pump subunit AcrA (membrane-fusion protein)
LTEYTKSNISHLEIELSEMGRILQLNGIVDAGRRATLSAQVSGRVEQLHFDEVDLVKRS